MPGSNLAPDENPFGYIFISKDQLSVVHGAATALAKKRREELERAKQGTPKGSEI